MTVQGDGKLGNRHERKHCNINVFYYPIRSQCTLSLPPENIRKPSALGTNGLNKI